MPRRNRTATAGSVWHVLNRRAGRQQLFSDDRDYAAFEKVLDEAGRRVPMRLLAYCLMPNHWHLLLWPRGDDDLSNYMQWLATTHAQRWHGFRGTAGTGPLYQGRFKAFEVGSDDHFYSVCRYVERNALRARLVARAEDWRWSSLWQRHSNRCDVPLAGWPLPRPKNWVELVNQPQTEQELNAIRGSVIKCRAYGIARSSLGAASREGGS